MSDEPPTQQLPPEAPRQLTRSTSDSVIGGVAGGLGRHLNVDPLAIRITFVILSFAGGLGILAYLACLVFIPRDDSAAPPMRWGVARITGAGLLTVAAIAILAPGWLWGPQLVVLLAAGVIVYLLIRVVRDDGASRISGVAARVAIGVVLLALPLAAVAAADLDVRGTWGDRTFRPATVAELGDGYDMGVGAMRVDLRDLELPPGRTELPLQLGVGEIQVLAPDDMCVTTDGSISLGAFDAGAGGEGGIDLDVEERRSVDPGVSYLHLDVDLGIGAVHVGDRFADRHDGPPWASDRPLDEVDPGTSRAACEAAG